MNTEMQPFWNKVQDLYPIRIDGRQVSYEMFKDEMGRFLDQIKAGGRSFSHFGLVVDNIDNAMSELSEHTGTELTLVKKTWMDLNNVHVGRLNISELELVEPDGDGMYLDALKTNGRHFHHISYTADSLEAINQCLENIKDTAEIIDENPHKGGILAFIKLKKSASIWIEYGFTKVH